MKILIMVVMVSYLHFQVNIILKISEGSQKKIRLSILVLVV